MTFFSFQSIEKLLPLSVEEVNFDWTTLLLGGKNWSLRITTAWRIVDSKNFVSGCADEYVITALERIKNTQIIGITAQSNEYPYDLSLKFLSEDKMEVFSLNQEQSWKFQHDHSVMVESDFNNFI